ncbi:hypothetical protein AGMMS50212_13500 [Spirochaetia bacterium]|nr:hypothetical protein AGMMS50212_13500 [Spirochaetia bacterium]
MPFAKGRSGNPGGRPKKDTTLTELLNKYRSVKYNRDGKWEKAEKLLIKAIWETAFDKKDVNAMKYILDRLDGKPIETIRAEVSGKDINIFKVTEKELFDSVELERLADESNAKEFEGIMGAAETADEGAL